ncbi:MAG: alanine/ornithine racemase family PLP-dependent enzyme [Bacteroidales bacterium]|nr:alanine/ornithine racemase family PLP-dependent enzyme [Bacteroidales bacterium]
MAFIELDKKKLQHNYKYLDSLFKKHNISWGIVTKVLCGNEVFLKEVLDLGINQVCDSRTTNLSAIKKLKPNIETVYIKPPAKRNIKEVVKYADISFNTEYSTIRALSDEAKRQDKVHRIIIMIEMGDLREGVMRDEFIDFYARVFELPNTEVVGIGTNLNCLNGVLPNNDKLIQLSLYKQLIEARFNKKIPLVSGGSSVTIPLLFKELLPFGITHFRIGETLFFGNDLYNNTRLKNMETHIFRLFAEIIELSEKPMVPEGEMGTNVAGHAIVINEENYGRTSFRAIIDLGLLDVEDKNLRPLDKQLTFVGASSDMIVLDLGDNNKSYKVGDLIEFEVNYLGALSVLNSNYIEKKIVQ